MKTYLIRKSETKALENVAETVKTIEKISASELKELKWQYENMSSYLTEVNIILYQLSVILKKEVFFDNLKNNFGNLSIVITGNKGLVGELYQQVQNLAVSIDSKYLITIGTKANAIDGDKLLTFTMPEDDILNSAELKNTVQKILDVIHKNTVSKVTVIYPNFFGFTNQKAKVTQIYPVNSELTDQNFDINIPIPTMLIREPADKIILKALTDLYLETFITKSFCETKLCEIATRLLSSQKAYDKALNLIKQSKHKYLKERRVEATNQQLQSFVGHINLS